MNKLFDENEEEEKEDPEFQINDINEVDEEDEDLRPSLTRDKIFENDYNSGNIDFEEYSNIPKVDSFYAENNLEECYDSYEYHRQTQLEILVDEYFKETEMGRIFAVKKKLPKQNLPQVFVSIREQFIKTDYTNSEIFTAIADYFRINYEVLYENIPSVYRAELVKELDDKYNVLKRKGVKKLF